MANWVCFDGFIAEYNLWDSNTHGNLVEVDDLVKLHDRLNLIIICV